MTRRIHEKALPLIDAPIAVTMRIVLQLWREAGQDLAAGTIVDSFIGFCLRQPKRPHETLKEIEPNPEEFSSLLPATIIAGSRQDCPTFLTEAIRLCEARILN